MSFEHTTSKIERGVQLLTRWIICVLLLAGCSKPPAQSAEEPLPELTLEQEAQLSYLNKMYLDVQSLASWGSKDIFRRMSSELNGLQDCELDYMRPSDELRSLPTRGYFFTVIDGDQCPIQMSHRTGYRVSDTSGAGHVDVSLEYATLKESLRQRSDLRDYEIHGRLEVQKSKAGTELSGYLNGQIRTREIPSIPLRFYISLKDDARFYRSAQNVRIQFPKFIVFAEAVRIRQGDKSVEVFKLNGRTIEKSGFERIVGGFLPTQGPITF